MRYQVDFEPVSRMGQCQESESLLDCARQLGVGVVSLCGGGAGKVLLMQGAGFKADFFAEVLHALCDRGGYSEYVASHLEITGTEDMRDKKAIECLVSAYLKLLFPDLRLTINLAEWTQSIK